ncbi:hypothetical protein BT96DRAFT_890908 [Gymnopus androsaceus JB14]|uniref:ASST-domain-containing protein n=1 Tax=Gymnopus androsaceus JB14 TaxID=1447944 RepID=A0A6A4GRD7_9AGAR|nr:hypothetical protein BT96DRAFT_890908 [Gymnopus androsaceus JB14]
MFLVSASIFTLLSFTLPRLATSSAAYCNNQDYESGALGLSPYQTYNAAPYNPVQINYALPPCDCPANSQVSGYFFFSPLGLGNLEMSGGLILNPDGTLVYSTADLALVGTVMRGPMRYRGKDYLTLWPVRLPLIGNGYNVLLNSSYDVVVNITTSGLSVGADLHEFLITADNTALMTAYPTTAYDLQSFNGSQDGYVLNCVVQEVDIATGKPLFTWQALDHVHPSECSTPLGTPFTGDGTAESPWDYFHTNSIQKNDDGTYLISSKHCSTLYLVDASGEIIWRMGGEKSDFTMKNGTNFTFQHHARSHGPKVISVFDDGAAGWEVDVPYPRGLLLDYDDSAMTVSLLSERLPFNRSSPSTSEGSVQVLSNGNSIVGWGSMPAYSEHDRRGDIMWSAQFAASNEVSAYRLFLQPWVGRPRTPPLMSIANSSSTENVTVYAWWNGATETTSWQLRGSSLESPLKTITLTAVNKTDFETTLTYTGPGYAYYQVVAMNGHGQTLGFSNFTGLDGTTFGKGENQTVTAHPL